MFESKPSKLESAAGRNHLGRQTAVRCDKVYGASVAFAALNALQLKAKKKKKIA